MCNIIVWVSGFLLAAYSFFVRSHPLLFQGCKGLPFCRFSCRLNLLCIFIFVPGRRMSLRVVYGGGCDGRRHAEFCAALLSDSCGSVMRDSHL